jgi:YesN/AraC family two-component response regulator
LADYIGINRSYLNYCFQRTVSMSPQKYLAQFRMNKAKILLKTTGLSISAIAAEVGYEDAFAFSKVFRKVCKMNPRAYRSSSEETIESASVPEH